MWHRLQLVPILCGKLKSMWDLSPKDNSGKIAQQRIKPEFYNPL